MSGTVAKDTIPIGTGAAEVPDSVAQDTIAMDSAVAGEQLEGLLFVNTGTINPEVQTVRDDASQGGDAMSWVLLVLALLFTGTALKFKGNSKYMGALVDDLTETRVRHNAFDETVRETSLLVMLNIVWVACAGVLLWKLLCAAGGMAAIAVGRDEAKGILICGVVAAIYIAMMMGGYWMVGRVFSDRNRTRMWLKGAGASNGLETFLLFPCALMAMCTPGLGTAALWCGGVVFLTGKIIFLYKGFRIFFSQISSLLLFLYYLCSLEIVPLILAYAAAREACDLWL